MSLTLEEERIFIRRQLFFDWRLKMKQKNRKKNSARPTDETLKRDSMIKNAPKYTIKTQYYVKSICPHFLNFYFYPRFIQNRSGKRAIHPSDILSERPQFILKLLYVIYLILYLIIIKFFILSIYHGRLMTFSQCFPKK